MAGVSSAPSTSPQWVTGLSKHWSTEDLIVTLLLSSSPPLLLSSPPPLLPSSSPPISTHTEPEQVTACVALCVVPQLPGGVRKGPGVLAAPAGWWLLLAASFHGADPGRGEQADCEGAGPGREQ